MLLERQHAVHTSPEGRVPSFVGADAAAALLADHPSWKAASVIKAVPDRAQMPVRARAPEEGKRVYMAASKLAAQKPFYLLGPETLTIPPPEAAERHTAARYARPVDLDEMPHVDLVVHELQIVDEELPEAGHDFRVDLIITQDRVMECSPYRRPPGIVWESLTPEAIEAIPALASRRP